MKNLLAQTSIDFGPKGGAFKGVGSGIFANPDPANSASNFEMAITNIISVMTVIAGLWFIFTLLIGAIGWLTAGADKGAVESARKRIANGLTGLVIVVIALFIVSLVGQFLGFDILNIAGLITSLSGQ